MDNAKFGSRGFTLIASLLLLLLMSGFALGLLMMVNTEQRVGGFDLNNSYASCQRGRHREDDVGSGRDVQECAVSNCGPDLCAQRELPDVGSDGDLSGL